MTTQRDTQRAIAQWYAQRQAPVRERLLELLVAYSPEPGESTEAVIARMCPDDKAEALDLAAEISPLLDGARRAVVAGRP